MSNLIKQLADLREKFSTSAENQDTMISTLLGDLGISPGFITDGYGKTISINSISDTGLYEVLMSVGSNLEFQSVTTGSPEQIKEYFENILDNQKGLIKTDNYSMNLNTFINDATSGMNLNLTLAAILDKYTTNQYMTSSDLNSIIDSMNLSSGQAYQVKTMINLSTNDDGKVDVYTFLQALKTVCDKSVEELEDGSLSLDNSDIPYLDNFLATAIPGLISTITSVIGAILTAVNAVIGVIVTVVGGVISSITNAILGTVPSEVNLKNPASITNWFDGPTTSRYDTLPYTYSTGVQSDITDTDVSILRDGVFDVCMFVNSKDNKLACNKFLTLALDRDKIWNWLADNLSVNYQTSAGTATVTFTRITPLTTPSYLPSNLYLDEYTENVVKGYSGREISNYIVSCFGAYCLAEVMFAMKNSYKNSLSFTWYDSAASSSPIGILQDLFKHAANNIGTDPGNLYIMNRIARGIHIWYYVKDNGWYHDFPNDSLTEIGLTECALCNSSSVNYITQVHNDTDVHGFDASPTNRIHWQIASKLNYVPSLAYSNLDFSANGAINVKDYYGGSSALTKVSTIPTARMFLFAGYSETALIVFAAVSATLVAATMIAGSIIAKKIKKFKWKKQMNNKRKLMDIQSTYANNPTDANLDALYRAQKKYNFKAKLFGWDTYDAANNWWNPPETSSDGDPNASLLDLKALIAG